MRDVTHRVGVRLLEGVAHLAGLLEALGQDKIADVRRTAVEALRAFPTVNASVDGTNIVLHKECNIGIAVALDWGRVRSRLRIDIGVDTHTVVVSFESPTDRGARQGHASAFFSASHAARCVACHNVAAHPPAPSCLASKDSGCTDCHMPAVTFGSRLNFANHWIGVYGKNQLKPVR